MNKVTFYSTLLLSFTKFCFYPTLLENPWKPAKDSENYFFNILKNPIFKDERPGGNGPYIVL